MSNVKQVLKWRGKEWERGTCGWCGKTTALLNPNKRIEGLEETCYKCCYRNLADMEKLAAELQAATLGGVWSEPRLEVPPEATPKRIISHHFFAISGAEAICRCGMRVDLCGNPITPIRAGLDKCPSAVKSETPTPPRTQVTSPLAAPGVSNPQPDRSPQSSRSGASAAIFDDPLGIGGRSGGGQFALPQQGGSTPSRGGNLESDLSVICRKMAEEVARQNVMRLDREMMKLLEKADPRRY
jgi:hypothetical protein